MKSVEFNPKKDLLIPIGLYTDQTNHMCNLYYPMEIDGKWGFPEEMLSLKLNKVYYAISPAAFPLAPEVRLYYTNVAQQGNLRYLTSIKELTDPFDVPGIIAETDLLKKPSGIMFAAYRKPLKNTTPIYSFWRNSTLGSILFLSENEKETGNWTSKYSSPYNIISPIFFVDCDCSGFIKEDNFCYVSTESKETINQCTESIIPQGSNIHSLTTSETSVSPQKTSHGVSFAIFYISSVVIFLTAFVGIIFLRK
jgi:hypothetical protein